MNNETKTCQNCKNQFAVEPDDFDFYAKIKVPPPTFCPPCRLQRRLAFFNIFNLYKRPCDLCKKDFISMYRADTPYTIYCPKCWWSDDWDTFEYGREYDFSRPFFEQYNELLHRVPLIGASIDIPTMETSPYTNHAGHLKNSYLLFHVDYVEDSAYGFNTFNNKSLFDCTNLILSELSYDIIHAYKISRSAGSQDLLESINCFFMKDSENCQDCFASANLRNKKHYIFNEPYSKEDYFDEIKKWNLGSYKIYQEVKKRAEEHWKKFPPDPIYQKFAINSTGNRIYESKNCKECFEVSYAEDCKWAMMMYIRTIKDCYDVVSWGNNMSRSYECCNVGEDVSEARFCSESGLGLMDAEYCKLSTGNHHFGCVSVKKGDYVILNKKYSEDEYRKLREKIIAQMNELPYVSRATSNRGPETREIIYKYGEFFPAEISPFAYNETIANNFFPLEKEKVLANSWRWNEPETHAYSITKHAQDLPDHIKDAGDDILKEVIACAKCGRGFRIIRMELDFLRRMNLPLPRECPFCRIGEKFNYWVKESRLVKRTCDKCGAEFDSPHTKENYPKILCKKHWLEEVV